MKAQDKKLFLAMSNMKLNNALDGETFPPAVLSHAKRVIAEADRYGWFCAKERGLYNVRCSSCQTSFVTKDKPRHMSKLTCLNCGTEIFVRKDSRSKDFYQCNRNNICFLQKQADAVIARFYQNDRYYSDRKYIRHIEKDLREYCRIIFRPEGVRKFERRTWRDDANWYAIDSIREAYPDYDMCQTTEELRGALANSYLKNSPWLEYSELRLNYSDKSIYSLYKFATWPALEYFLKLGYKKLVSEIIGGRTAEDKTLNLYKNKFNEVLGVPHSILQKYDHADLQERDIKAIKQLIDFGRLGQLTPERFKFIQSVLTNNSLDPLDVFRSFGLEKVFNYLDKQIALAEQEVDAAYGYRKVDRRMAWGDFRDYRRECHELGYDLTDEGVLFPRDMYAAHRRTSEILNQRRERERKAQEKLRAKELNERLKQQEEEQKKRAEEQAEKYAAVIKRYLNKDFANDNFMLRIARSPSEIIAEGSALKHCVGGYVERVADILCLIFFVRSVTEPDKPLYTLELNFRTKSVVQCRGFQNKNAPPEVFQFVQDALSKNFKQEAASERAS